MVSKPDCTAEQLTSASHPQSRPVRQAALQGCEKVQRWTHSLLSPPEDVKY